MNTRTCVVSVLLLVLSLVMVVILLQSGRTTTDGGGDTGTVASSDRCVDPPFRQEEAALLMQEPGAVLTYERNGGPRCIDELYVIYSDGRIVGDNGETQIEKQITPEEVQDLLEGIDALGWYTDEMYNTWHTRCGQCYGYYITVSFNGQVKTVKGVDGGTDAPTKYWDAAALIIGVIPKFN